jgi:hypothetical protein
MHENVIAGSALDESIALRVVKPLHLALFLFHFHFCPLNLPYRDCLVPLSQPLAKNNKSHKINDSVAFQHSGTRSQKLIKQT